MISRYRFEFVVCLILALVVAAIYGQTMNHEFINFDDDVYIYENPYIKDGLTEENIKWAFTDAYGGNWHPLTWISHMLDIQVFGKNSGAHHLVNASLHLVNGCLLFFILRRSTGCLWKSAFVAAFFVVHPLRVESVAWAAERKDVLSAFFGFLTIFVYLLYVEKPNLTHFLWVVFLFTLGLLAKPMLVTLPILLLALDYWPLQRLFNKETDTASFANLLNKFFEKLPLLALVGVSSWLTIKAQSMGSSIKSFEEFPLWIRFSNAFESYFYYLEKFIWPQNLILFYSHPKELITWLGGLAALFFLVVLTGLFFYIRDRFPFALMGWVWFLISLIPVIGLVQVGHQSLADRYTYIPSIGITVLIVWGCGSFIEKQSQRLGTVLGIAVFIVLSYSAWVQASKWKNNETIYQYVLEIDPENKLALHNYAADINQKAKKLAREGNFEEAYVKWGQAIKMDPQYAALKVDFGNALVSQGKLESAEEQYRLAINIQPEDALTLANLGSVLIRKGKIDQALEEIDHALRLKPDFLEALIFKAGALTLSKNYLGAIDQYKRALAIDSNQPEIYNNLGGLLLSVGRISEATNAFQNAIKWAPHQPGFIFNLGRAYWIAGKKKEAIRIWENILKLRPDYEPAKLALSKAVSKDG
jgi:protein O-mannosyl-transferase